MKKWIFAISILLFAIGGYAQNLGSLQWVSGGGSATNSGSPGNFDEGVYFMGTDVHGNVYAASEINSALPQLDSFAPNAGLGNMDLILFSYNCAGQLRWVRQFACAASEKLSGLNVDNIGNCYISGLLVINPTLGIFGKLGDTTIPANTFPYIKNNFYAKVDSNGHTLWVNYPGLNVPLVLANTVNIHKSQLDKNGVLHSLAHFNGTNTWGGNAVPIGFNVVKLDANNGQIVGTVLLKDYTRTNFSLYGATNNKTYFEMDDANNYYLMTQLNSGDTITIGTEVVQYYPAPYDTAKNILAKWDSSGNLLWHKVHKGGNTTIYNSGLSYTTFVNGMKVLDNDIYLVGGARDSIGVNTFLGFNLPPKTKTFANSSRGLIIKINGLNGDGIWVNSNEKVYGGNFIGSSFGILPNNDLYVLGSGYGINGTFYINNSIDSLQITEYLGGASQTLIIIDPQTGYVKYDTGIVHSGNNVVPYISAVDKNGNIYFGGSFNGKLWNSAHTDSCSLWGGNSDFYIAKYGNVCGCNTYKPWPKLLATTVSSVNALCQDVVFGSDSLVWFWGDGTSTSTKCDTAATSHTYAAGGTYNVCLRNYSPCGFADSCFTVNIVLATNELAVAQIDVYPNPTHLQVTISYPYVQKGIVTFYNLQGKAMQTANLQNGVNTIALENLPLGLYTYSVVAQSGQVYKGKLVLQ